LLVAAVAVAATLAVAAVAAAVLAAVAAAAMLAVAAVAAAVLAAAAAAAARLAPVVVVAAAAAGAMPTCLQLCRPAGAGLYSRDSSRRGSSITQIGDYMATVFKPNSYHVTCMNDIAP
jgi:hypothetical protein